MVVLEQMVEDVQVELPLGGDTVILGPGLRRETGQGARVTR